MRPYYILISSLVLVLMASCSSSKPVADSSSRRSGTSYSNYNHWDHVASSSPSTSSASLSKSKDKKSKDKKTKDEDTQNEDAWFSQYAQKDAKTNTKTEEFDEKRVEEFQKTIMTKCKEYSKFNEKWRSRDSKTYIKKARKAAPYRKK